MDDIRIGSFGLEKVVQIIWRLEVEIGILSLYASSDVFQSDTGGIAEVGRADAVNRVLVKPEVQEGQLADGRKAAWESVWENSGSAERTLRRTSQVPCRQSRWCRHGHIPVPCIQSPR